MKVTKDKPAFCNTNEINIVDKHDYTMKDIDSVGGKGYNLLRLKSEGFNVPDFFILPTEHFNFFVKHGVFKDNFKEDIKLLYDEIIKFGLVAVRSSATIEDMDRTSNAGRFETVLGVAEDKILDAIKTVYTSMITSRLAGSMAVIIQKQILSEKSGVAFVDKNNVAINAVLGQGNMLVSGEQTGDFYVINPDGTYNVKRTIQNKCGTISDKNINLNPQIGWSQKLSDIEIKLITDVSKNIRNKFNSDQDIEWAIHGSVLFILQTRPITSNINITSMSSLGVAIPVSEGVANAALCFDVNNIPDYDVILVVSLIEMPDFKKLLGNKKIKGLITEIGGMLSHEGILARENHIPFISGIRSPKKLLSGFNNIIMDASKPSIIANGKELIDSSIPTYAWLSKDIVNLHVIYFDGDGVVYRQIDNFIIIYSPLINSKAVEFFVKKFGADKIILASPQDKVVVQDVYKHALVSMQQNTEINSLMLSASEGMYELNSLKIEKAYNKLKDIAVKHFGIAQQIFEDYILTKDTEKLRFALTAVVLSFGAYRCIRLMPTYWEYVFGNTISKKEGRVLTDNDIYQLQSQYTQNNPQILKVTALLEYTLNEIDEYFMDGHSNKIMDFSAKVILEAAEKLGEKEMELILFGEK